VGEYVNNRRQGQGVFYYPDGSKYEGSWFEDLRSGSGTYTYANGDSYQGKWANNVRDGEGVYTYSATGSQYAGIWCKGRRHGNGQLIHASCRYVGSFTDDQTLGSAKFIFARGCEQAGEFLVDDTKKDDAAPTTSVKWQGQGFHSVQG